MQWHVLRQVERLAPWPLLPFTEGTRETRPWHAVRLRLAGEQADSAGAAQPASAAQIEGFLLRGVAPVLLGRCCPAATRGAAPQAQPVPPSPWADAHCQSPTAGPDLNAPPQQPSSTRQPQPGVCPRPASQHPVLRTSILQAPVIRVSDPPVPSCSVVLLVSLPLLCIMLHAMPHAPCAFRVWDHVQRLDHCS